MQISADPNGKKIVTISLEELMSLLAMISVGDQENVAFKAMVHSLAKPTASTTESAPKSDDLAVKSKPGPKLRNGRKAKRVLKKQKPGPKPGNGRKTKGTVEVPMSSAKAAKKD